MPVDAFWSISVYNRDGYFEPNDRGAYNVNSVMAEKNDDGSTTVHFGGCDDGRVNCLPIVEGWNYAVRLYRPRADILDGSYASRLRSRSTQKGRRRPRAGRCRLGMAQRATAQVTLLVVD